MCAGLGARQAQREREADEALLGTVVQVPLEPPPLGVAGGYDASPGGWSMLPAPLWIRQDGRAAP